MITILLTIAGIVILAAIWIDTTRIWLEIIDMVLGHETANPLFPEEDHLLQAAQAPQVIEKPL